MHFIQLLLRPEIIDSKGKSYTAKAAQQLNLSVGGICTAKIFAIDDYFSAAIGGDRMRLLAFAQDCLQDAITDVVLLDELEVLAEYPQVVAVAKLAGVTDDEGISTQEAFVDYFGLDIDSREQHIFSQEIYYIAKPLADADLRQFAHRMLGNPLINHFSYFSQADAFEISALFVPQVRLNIDDSIQYFDLANADDAALLAFSKDNVWSLNLAEMQAIKAHFANATTLQHRQAENLTAAPTDCEMEILAQTWSEHCKHKEFNAVIEYYDPNTSETKTVRSLFKSYIRAATEYVRENLLANGNDWLIKIFTDNAGVVKINDEKMFVWKVETHNSPSALDPYGGAITGILGNNRDPLCTGVGGARLLFNTNVLCFGMPDMPQEDLLKNQLHPRQIMEGVVSGIKDGGNKSGVPTVNGAIVFDARFGGKPLVYCGTGGIMPHHYKGKNSWEKPIDAGDKIVMLGGRVGKDGIHGATFSSLEIDEHSPMSAVQIGSPITQKKAADFLIQAAEAGLLKCSTDNGAGGLSSSVGELATISGGAEVWLDRVPLKYAGLRAWEIFVSESQERMTLAVAPQDWAELQKLAELYAVELSDIGVFTDSGFLDIRFGSKKVAYLDMEFLHEGVPQKYLQAIVPTPTSEEPILSANIDYNDVLRQLLAAWNICSRESIIRRYDHEVKGKSIIKPLMGKTGKAPQDAAVVRLDFDGYEGIAVSNGIVPRYGDLDAYEMSAGAFDEAVRQIISVGGRLPNMSYGDGIFWSVNDNFCVPDSVFDAESNPDGKEKLAKLVQMCEALYDMATYFDIPLTSGKDSMKNDFKSAGVKISVPPTILYSMTAKIEDVRKVVTSDFKAVGDLIYQVGATYNELGGSEFYQLLGELGKNVPRVRKAEAKATYTKMIAAHATNLLQSSHDLSDGGLAVSLAESCWGGGLGAQIDLQELAQKSELDATRLLFAESHSRFVVSIKATDKARFESIFGDTATLLGTVQSEKLDVSQSEKTLIAQNSGDLMAAWQSRKLI